MLLKETLKEAIELQKIELENSTLGVERNLLKLIDKKSKQIVIISGIRRCGKSTLLKQITSNMKNYNYFKDKSSSEFTVKRKQVDSQVNYKF